MILSNDTAVQLLNLWKTKKVGLEGNILKVIQTKDEEFQKYIDEAKQRDNDQRRKRLEVTKQVQSQNKDLIESQADREKLMIESILLVDDEDLFHLVFEDSCSLLDITLSLQSLTSSDEADRLFKKWFNEGPVDERPECVFVDLNIIGSSFDGIELIRKINTEYGNGVVIGIISSSDDKQEIDKAKSVGAQFWIIKSDEIEPRLEAFRRDYQGYKNKTAPFKVYKWF